MLLCKKQANEDCEDAQTELLLKNPFTGLYAHTHTHTLMKRKKGWGSAVTSHRSACPVSLAGDSLPQTLSKYTCYSFPTRQRRRARPDKAIYPSPAQPVQTLSLMFSLLQEINMLGSRQTTPALPGRLFPFSRPPLGALTADVHKRINKQRFSRVNTGHNQQRRIYSAKDDQCGPYVDQHSSPPACQVMSASRKQTAGGILI